MDTFSWRKVDTYVRTSLFSWGGNHSNTRPLSSSLHVPGSFVKLVNSFWSLYSYTEHRNETEDGLERNWGTWVWLIITKASYYYFYFSSWLSSFDFEWNVRSNVSWNQGAKYPIGSTAFKSFSNDEVFQKFAHFRMTVFPHQVTIANIPPFQRFYFVL